MPPHETLRHGKLAIDIPADWSDRTSLLLVGLAQPAASVATTKSVQPSVAVSWTRAPDGDARTAARAILDDELAGMKPFALEVLAVADYENAIGKGVLSMHRVRLVLEGKDVGLTVRQLHAVVVQGTIAVRAVASCADSEFMLHEKTLRAALASLRFEDVRFDEAMRAGGSR